MMDKEKFNETFQDFDAETTIVIIDLYFVEHSEIITALANNISDSNLVQVKLNAHKFRTPSGQLGGMEVMEHARRMEEAADKKIIAITYSMLRDLPETLQNLQEVIGERELVRLVTLVDRSIKKFLISLNVPFSDENTLKLLELEKANTSEGLPGMFEDLKESSTQFVAELLLLKKELTNK